MGEEDKIYRRKGENSMEWDEGKPSLLQIHVTYSGAKMATGWVKTKYCNATSTRCRLPTVPEITNPGLLLKVLKERPRPKVSTHHTERRLGHWFRFHQNIKF